MNISHSLPSTVEGVSFSFLSAEDIRRISVKQIVNPVLLDDLNRPNVGGLYDPALGPHDRADVYVPVLHLELANTVNEIDLSAVARHAISPTSPALGTLDTSSSRHLFFILCSWETCTISFADAACFAINSR